MSRKQPTPPPRSRKPDPPSPPPEPVRSTISEQHIRMTAQLYEARDLVRRLLGDTYHKQMAELGAIIASVVARDGIGEIESAIKLCQQIKEPFVRLSVLAAVVELAEPTP